MMDTGPDPRSAGPAFASARRTRTMRRPGPAMLLVTELEDYTISYANGLAAHHPVMLCVPERQYGRLAQWVAPEVDLRLLDWPRHRSLANLGLLATLSRLMWRERPSLVHLLSNNTLWLNLAAPLWRRVPLVTTVHDVQVHPGDRETAVLPPWSTSLMARQSDHLFVHGEALKSAAMERFGKPADRVHAISHPAIPRYAALARRAGLTPPEGDKPFTVLLFGRIYAYKGFGTLVRAEALLRDRLPDLRVIVAGRGDDPQSLASEMGRPACYDIRNRFIEDEEVARLFLEADVVALPYSEASQSGVLHVAGTFGKPVVATDVGELGRTVRGRGLGLVVPPDDPHAFADALERLARQPEMRTFLGQQARAFAEGDNRPEAVGARAAALYRRIARSPAERHADAG